MSQDDNRVCTELLGPPGSKCDNASTPYRSGNGVEITDHVARSRRITEIGWNYVRVVYERSRRGRARLPDFAHRLATRVLAQQSTHWRVICQVAQDFAHARSRKAISTSPPKISLPVTGNLVNENLSDASFVWRLAIPATRSDRRHLLQALTSD